MNISSPKHGGRAGGRASARSNGRPNQKVSDHMPRACFQLRVRRDRIDEYRNRHAAVWPDMLDARAGMESADVNARWQAEMADFFEGLVGRSPDEGFDVLEEVFHLEDQLGTTEVRPPHHESSTT